MAISSSNSDVYELKPVEIVYDEDRIKILIDDTRKMILSVLGDEERDMSVTEIAELMNTNPQRIYHHVDKLVEYKFLTKTREERKKRSITTYYARTAKAFIVSYSTDRGVIDYKELINHFLTTFRQILGIDLTNEEEKDLGKNIGKLASLSPQVFTQYSNSNDQDSERHSIENLYFLLEYLIFYTHPEARDLIENIKDLLLPKLNQKGHVKINTVKY